MGSLHEALAVAAVVVAAQKETSSPPSGSLGALGAVDAAALGAADNVALGAVASPVLSEEEEDPEERVSWHTSDSSTIPAASSPSLLSEDDEHLQAPVLRDGYLPDAEDLEVPHQPDYLDVYFPHVHMPHYDNLAFAYLDPPHASPATTIHQAALVGCGPNRVSLLSSSRGAKLAIFLTPEDRENAVLNGPYVGRECSVHFERHDESDNRFTFQHESFAALAITDYPHEHWFREHIQESSVPFANPHQVDPICLTGLDYTAVLITVKAESLSDIPSSINFKNHSSSGSVGQVSIIAYEDILGSEPSSGPSSPSGGSDANSFAPEFDEVEIDGEMGFGDVLAALGMAPPVPDANAASCVAPAASLLDRALAAAPPMPLVRGEPLRSKPKQAIFKVHLGFFDIFAVGSLGERLFFRIPMRRAAGSSGCEGLLAVNLAAASVGVIHSIATLGPERHSVLTVDVLARGDPICEASDITLALASSLLLGDAAVPAPVETALQAAPPVTPSLDVPVPDAFMPALGAALPIVHDTDMGSEILVPAPQPVAADGPMQGDTAAKVVRRSARLVDIEPAKKLTILDKAKLRKAACLAGGDIDELAEACEISPSALASSASPAAASTP